MSNATFLHSIPTFHFRKYERATLIGEDIVSQNQDLGYFHNAIFKKSSDLQVMASCVTFAAKDRVPPGSLYNVRKVINKIDHFVI